MSLTGIAFPLGFLKSTVENAVKNATGRTLVLDGKFGVVPGFSPVARISNVTLSNPEGFEEQTMASVESLSAEFQVEVDPSLKRRTPAAALQPPVSSSRVM